MIHFEKFPSINNFHSVNRVVGKFWNMEMQPTIRYIPKMKVQVAHASICITPEGEIFIDGSTEFKEWVKNCGVYWDTFKRESPTILYGDWTSKFFFVHTILFGESSYLFDPAMIEKMLGKNYPCKLEIMQYNGDGIYIDFKDIGNLIMEGNNMYIPKNIVYTEKGTQVEFSEDSSFKIISAKNFKNFAFET